MNEDKYDIVIVGAGLAGLATAFSIKKQAHLKIAIIEGASVGSNNPSPLTFSKTLEKYNLSDCVKGKLACFAFHNYQGSLISYSFTDHPLSVLDYQKACLKLFSFLRDGPGPVDYINKRAAEFLEEDDAIKIRLHDHSFLRADLMIDCSGKSKFAASKHEYQNTLSYYSHVYGAVFSNVDCPDPESGCFLWPCTEFGSGGGWFYPMADGKASYGYATISDSSCADLRDLELKFRKAVETFEPYASYLKNAVLEKIESGTIPISYIKSFVHDRIMIVGDAAGMATNWTCMGVEPALKYGSLAGEIAAKAMSQRNFDILNEFQHQWERDNKDIYDFVARNASVLWTPNHYLWEWVIKNDLAFLSPSQALDRMQSNSHLLNKYKIIVRALIYKIKSIIDKNISEPRTISK